MLLAWPVIITADRLYWVNSAGGLTGQVPAAQYLDAGIVCDDPYVEVKRAAGGAMLYRCGGGRLTIWPFSRTKRSEALAQWWDSHVENTRR